MRLNKIAKMNAIAVVEEELNSSFEIDVETLDDHSEYPGKFIIVFISLYSIMCTDWLWKYFKNKNL